MRLKLAFGGLVAVFSVSTIADNHSIEGELNHSSTEW
jgi:hypothetical protein